MMDILWDCLEAGLFQRRGQHFYFNHSFTSNCGFHGFERVFGKGKECNQAIFLFLSFT